MVGVRFEGALVPDLRQLVVAELAIGITDQIGHVGMIVVAQRLQLLDGSRIIVAVIDRRIGCAIPLRKCWIVDAGLLVGLLLGLMGGFRCVGPAVRRRGRRRRRFSTTATPSRGKRRNDGGRRDQRHRKNCQRHQVGRYSDHVWLLLSCVAIPPADPVNPALPKTFPRRFRCWRKGGSSFWSKSQSGKCENNCRRSEPSQTVLVVGRVRPCRCRPARFTVDSDNYDHGGLAEWTLCRWVRVSPPNCAVSRLPMSPRTTHPMRRRARLSMNNPFWCFAARR